MPWSAKDGGAWRTITNPSVRVAGVWQPVTAAWVKVAGVWESFFSGVTVLITNQTVSDIGANNPAGAGYSLTNTGDVQTRVNFSPSTIGQWISPAAGMSGYDVRATVTGGGGGSLSGTIGSWLNLSASQTWELSSVLSSSYFDRTLLIEIRDAVSLVVVTSATITLQVEAL